MPIAPDFSKRSGAFFTESHKMSHPQKINIKQRLAARLLASGLTRDQTAKHVGVDPTTLSKWRKNPAFEDHIHTLLTQHEQEALQTMQALKLKAVERLSELLQSKSSSIALRAVEAVLNRTQNAYSTKSGLSEEDVAWRAMQQELERIAADANQQKKESQP